MEKEEKTVKKGKYKKIKRIGVTILVIFLISETIYIYFNHSKKNKIPTEFFENYITEMMSNDNKEDTPELTDTQIETNEIINSGDFKNPDTDVINFISQLKKQTDECIHNPKLKGAQEYLEKIHNIILDFTVTRNPLHGVSYYDLSNSTLKTVLSLCSDINFMINCGMTKEESIELAEEAKKKYENEQALEKAKNTIEDIYEIVDVLIKFNAH